MIIPMLQMREARLRKITWPPQATQVVEAEFQTRTACLQETGVLPVRQGEDPTPSPSEKPSPGDG